MRQDQSEALQQLAKEFATMINPPGRSRKSGEQWVVHSETLRKELQKMDAGEKEIDFKAIYAMLLIFRNKSLAVPCPNN